MEIKEEELRPGYNYDPYKDETAEDFFIGKLISKVTGDPYGFLSTAREWHIFLAGIAAGARARTLENVPECPPLWRDEKQYFDTPAMITNVIKCQWPSIVTFIAAMGTKAAGVW